MNITCVSEIVNIVVFLQSPDWVKMLYVRGHERGNPFYLRYLSRPVTSALTVVKDHALNCCETAFSNSDVNYFWSGRHRKTLTR